MRSLMPENSKKMTNLRQIARPQVVVLAYFQGLKYRDAADALGIPVGTVKSRLHAALARLTADWTGGEKADDPEPTDEPSGVHAPTA